jgi:hypothetical protein
MSLTHSGASVAMLGWNSKYRSGSLNRGNYRLSARIVYHVMLLRRGAEQIWMFISVALSMLGYFLLYAVFVIALVMHISISIFLLGVYSAKTVGIITPETATKLEAYFPGYFEGNGGDSFRSHTNNPPYTPPPSTFGNSSNAGAPGSSTWSVSGGARGR